MNITIKRFYLLIKIYIKWLINLLKKYIKQLYIKPNEPPK